MSLIDANELAQAFANRHFYYAYQPIIDLDTERVPYVEALIRWAHPTHGELSPGSFLSLIHGAGLSDTMTDFGLQTILADLPRLRSIYGPEIAVALNLSQWQLREPEQVADRIETALARAGEPASVLQVEVVEDLSRSDIARTTTAFARLRGLGVAIILDDFGTGASSLTALTEMVYDGLKIDHSFVRGLATSAAARSVIETVLQFGEREGVRVVAEGIETADDLRQLKGLGCRLGQGYFIARPQPVERMVPRVATDQVDESREPTPVDDAAVVALSEQVNAVDPRVIGPLENVLRRLQALDDQAVRLGTAADRIRVEIGRRICLAAVYAGDSEVVIDWAMRTSQLAESIGDWGSSAQVLAMIANDRDESKQTPGFRIDALIRALELRMTRPMDDAVATLVDNSIGAAFGTLGLWRHARRWWTDTMNRFGGTMNEGTALCCFNLAELEMDRLEGGVLDPDDTPRELGLAMADQMITQASENPFSPPGLASAFVARLYLQRGDMERVDEISASTPRSTSNILTRFQWLKVDAFIARERGDHQAFLEHTTALTDMLNGIQLLSHHHDLALRLHVEALRSVGRYEEGLDVLTDLYERSHAIGSERLMTLFDWIRMHLDVNARLQELLEVERQT